MSVEKKGDWLTEADVETVEGAASEGADRAASQPAISITTASAASARLRVASQVWTRPARCATNSTLFGGSP